MPFDILNCLSDHSPTSRRGPTWVLWVLVERNRFFQLCPTAPGAASLSFIALLFPFRRYCHHLFFSAPGSVALGRKEVALVKFLLKCPMYPNLFFLQWCAGNSPQGGWTSANSLSSMSFCPGQHTPGFLLTMVRGVVADSLAPLVPQLIPRSTYLLSYAQVGRIPPGPLGVWF